MTKLYLIVELSSYIVSIHLYVYRCAKMKMKIGLEIIHQECGCFIFIRPDKENSKLPVDIIY